MVKHKLKAKYYIRYVDDFVVLHESKEKLESFKVAIKEELSELKLELHPSKCIITSLRKGASFLGFRVFYHHKLVRLRNRRKIERNISEVLTEHELGLITADKVLESIKGWNAYAMHGNTYSLRTKLMQNAVRRLTNDTSSLHPLTIHLQMT